MAALLSTVERRILEATHEAEAEGADRARLTDVVRRRVGQFTGAQFRQGVAGLSDRRLLRARVATKTGGEIAQVVIERLTPLGNQAIGRGRP